MNLIRNLGVPEGIRWDKKFFMKCVHLIIMIVSQNISELGKFTDMWEVNEKIKGNIAVLLNKAIVKKIAAINIIPPLNVFLIECFTSFSKNFIIELFICLFIDFIHILDGIISKTMKHDIHDKDDTKLREGSKIENSLVVNI